MSFDLIDDFHLPGMVRVWTEAMIIKEQGRKMPQNPRLLPSSSSSSSSSYTTSLYNDQQSAHSPVKIPPHCSCGWLTDMGQVKNSWLAACFWSHLTHTETHFPTFSAPPSLQQHKQQQVEEEGEKAKSLLHLHTTNLPAGSRSPTHREGVPLPLSFSTWEINKMGGRDGGKHTGNPQNTTTIQMQAVLWRIEWQTCPFPLPLLQQGSGTTMPSSRKPWKWAWVVSWLQPSSFPSFLMILLPMSTAEAPYQFQAQLTEFLRHL